MIRLVIADDQAVVRAGLSVILGAEEDIEVVGEAADGAEAIALARELRPDVVCMDIRMPGTDGIAATRAIVSDPDLDVDVLILTTFDVDDDVLASLEAGAAGFLLKGADEDTLLGAVRSVAAGEGTLDQRVTRRILRELSRRGSRGALAGHASVHRQSCGCWRCIRACVVRRTCFRGRRLDLSGAGSAQAVGPGHVQR